VAIRKKKTKKKLKPVKAKKPARKLPPKKKRSAAGKPPAKLTSRAAAKTVRPAKKRPAAKPANKAPAVKRVAGLPGQLYDAALRVLADRQAEQIVTVELEGRSTMADYLIIASGRAQRQIAAIADYLREAFMKLGVGQVRIEGLPEANWVLVDAGDIVVHLFRPEVRDYYRLEDIWGRKKGR
jgi:ribosome-associated protein